jgi:hypothetical protein
VEKSIRLVTGPFLLAVAEGLRITHFFTDNLFVEGAEAVEILVEAAENQIEQLVSLLHEKRPLKALVEDITVHDYENAVMPIESYYRYLTATQLHSIATYGGEMLEKQDETIDILRSVKEDTAIIPEIKKDTAIIHDIKKDTAIIASIKEDTAIIPEIKKDTAIIHDIKKDTSEMRSSIGDAPTMFAEIIREMDRIKRALSKAGIEL